MKGAQILFISFFIMQIAAGQDWQDTLLIIDKALNQYSPDGPGCQVSVSRNGQLIFSKAWGMADLERRIPLTTNSILEAGSVSKQFTAAAILLLEQQGKLSLDDDVRKYIPEMPDYGTPIRLRQMLHHTSGLRDWGSIAEMTGWPRSSKFYTNEDALEIIIRQKHLNNKPGDEYLYSNSNYNLFAVIVQRVSGLTLAAYTRKYIFEPASMMHTQWRDDPNRIVVNRAIAYDKTDSSFETDMPNEYVYGNGGLLTTTEDLLKWNNYFLQGKLGTPSLLPKQIHTEPLNNGVNNPYGAGLFINKVAGWKSINHSGATAAYRAWLETFPELNISIAVLSNNSAVNIYESESRIRKIFVRDKISGNAKKDDTVKLSESDLSALSGMYRNERDGSTFTLDVKNNQILVENNLPMTAVTRNILICDYFMLVVNGNNGLYIPTAPVDSIPITKVKSAVLTQEDMNIYEGHYYSDETNSGLTVKLSGDKLTIHLNPDKSYSMIPTYADAFRIAELFIDMQFIRDTGNKMVMLKMSQGRARGVEFKKLP
jgi:CubicO group peptidase (beta-lactamase class C family)